MFDFSCLYIIKLNNGEAEGIVYKVGYNDNGEGIEHQAVKSSKSMELACILVKKEPLNIKLASTVLGKLVDSCHIFELEDQANIIDSLKMAKVKVYDDCYPPGMPDGEYSLPNFHCIDDYNLMEIKLGNKVRNIRIAQKAASCYRYNKKEKVFELYVQIESLIESLFAQENLVIVNKADHGL